jgi:peptidoglycan-associated lipoprotein
MSVHFGKKVAIISAVTLLLAACSKDNEPDPNAPGVGDGAGEVVETTTDSVSNVKSDAEIEAERLTNLYGAATLRDLEDFAGSDQVLFAYDSSELSASARDILAKQAEWMNYHSRTRFTIEGHCDERGTREYNLALGERRATAVKNYLVSLNVPASRLSTISYGKERPVSAGGHAQNRRGVLTFN